MRETPESTQWGGAVYVASERAAVAWNRCCEEFKRLLEAGLPPQGPETRWKELAREVVAWRKAEDSAQMAQRAWADTKTPLEQARQLELRARGDIVDALNASEKSKNAAHERIARVAHEVNRAYCQALGDNSQPRWEDAPQWQRDSAMLGVQLHTENPDASPAASHESWMAQKAADGWIYGVEKRPDLKQHPCMVPFDALPLEQAAKDFIFRAVVHALVRP